MATGRSPTSRSRRMACSSRTRRLHRVHPDRHRRERRIVRLHRSVRPGAATRDDGRERQYTPTSGMCRSTREWIKYDTFDNTLLPPGRLLLRDVDVPYTPSSRSERQWTSNRGSPASRDVRIRHDRLPNNIQAPSVRPSSPLPAPRWRVSGSPAPISNRRSHQTGTTRPSRRRSPAGGGAALPAPYNLPAAADASYGMDVIAARANFRTWEDRNALQIPPHREHDRARPRVRGAGRPVLPVYFGNDWTGP